MSVKIGCLNGCPLDHHEPPCPKAYPPVPSPVEDVVARTAYDLGRREGHRAGYEAGYEAGFRDARLPPVVIRGEAIKPPPVEGGEA